MDPLSLSIIVILVVALFCAMGVQKRRLGAQTQLAELARNAESGETVDEEGFTEADAARCAREREAQRAFVPRVPATSFRFEPTPAQRERALRAADRSN